MCVMKGEVERDEIEAFDVLTLFIMYACYTEVYGVK